MRRGPDDPLTPLADSAAAWARANTATRQQLAAACRQSLRPHVAAWVEQSLCTKGFAGIAEAEAEEWLSGPLAVARFLAALAAPPALPTTPVAEGMPPTATTVRPLPGPRGIGDALVLWRHRAEVHLDTTAGPGATPPHAPRGPALVLGAGNVTAVPLLDALDQVFVARRSVLLKLHPLHTPLVPLFTSALAPLVGTNLLRIVAGDAEAGAVLARDERVVAVHLTGSDRTWQRLHHDPALRRKVMTAEVGCTAPVLVVPGAWSERDLGHAAEQLAAYAANNGGATCLAPRLLVLAERWSQREHFLALVERALAARPSRRPFLPGVREHYARLVGRGAAEHEALPPRLRRFTLDEALEHGRSEWFAPVLGAVSLPGDSAEAWLHGAAVPFAAERCFGSLAAYVFAPPAVLRQNADALRQAIHELPHGTIAIDTWAGIAFGLGTAPWGVPHDRPAAHGRGWQRNLLGTGRVRRVVVQGPLHTVPRAPWLPRQRRAAAMLAALTRHTLTPTPIALARTLFHAVV
jgi:aldehyde dehydrogenase (NAD(P)+)